MVACSIVQGNDGCVKTEAQAPFRLAISPKVTLARFDGSTAEGKTGTPANARYGCGVTILPDEMYFAPIHYYELAANPVTG